MSSNPMRGRRRGTLASGKIAHHTYEVTGDPAVVTVALESTADHDLLVNVDGSAPGPSNPDQASRSPNGTEQVTVEDPAKALGIGVFAREAGEYELSFESRGRSGSGGGGGGETDPDDDTPGRGDAPEDGGPRNPWPNKPNDMVIDGNSDGVTRYQFAVSGEIEQIGNRKANRELSSNATRIDGNVVQGIVSEGHDYFRFSGEITDWQFDGPARVIVNDEVERLPGGSDEPPTP